MNTVAFDFCQRVLATRKCCEGVNGECICFKARPPPTFADRKWNQSTKLTRFTFHIGLVNAEWKYGFLISNSRPVLENLLSIDGVKESPLLKNVRFTAINMCVRGNRRCLKHAVPKEDLQKLLRFVSLLSNEPVLTVEEHRSLSSIQGQQVLSWLAEGSFSRIITTKLQTVYPIVEKQFLRWKPTQIVAKNAVREGSERFLEKRLLSGCVRRLSIDKHYVLPSMVLKQIIRNFLKAPQDYVHDPLDIELCLGDSATDMLDKFAEGKYCKMRVYFPKTVRLFHRYTFKKQKLLLRVEQKLNYQWHLYTVDKD